MLLINFDKGGLFVPKKNDSNDSNENLKGTFYLSMSVGVIIVVVWAVCFYIFMDRF